MMTRFRTSRLRLRGATALLLLFGVASACLAQDKSTEGASPIRLAVGFGVDTTSAPVRELHGLLRAYVQESDPQRANAYWAREEQATYRDADLLRTFVFQGFTRFSLVHVGPTVSEPGVFELRVLVSRSDSATLDVYPLALYSVYAMREGERWVFSNALVHRTRAWARHRVGQLQYSVSSSASLDTAVVAKSAAYVDSLGVAFGIAVPPIEYYSAESLAAIYAALGLDYFITGMETTGGRALVTPRVVLVGGVAGAGSTRHELAHVVLGSLSRPQTHRLLTEGLATWVGGSAGLSYRELLPGLASWLSTHPNASLIDIMENPPARVGTLDVGYDVFAVIFDLAYERGGVTSVRSLMNSGPSPTDVLQTIARILGVATAQVDAMWRRRVGTVMEPR